MRYLLQWMDGVGPHEIESNDLNGLIILVAALRHVGNVQHISIHEADEEGGYKKIY